MTLSAKEIEHAFAGHTPGAHVDRDKETAPDADRPDRPFYSEAELRRRDALDQALRHADLASTADAVLTLAVRFQAFISEGHVQEPERAL